MTNEPTITTPSKSLIATEITKTYIATVISATYLKRYLMRKRGPIESWYLDFYEGFYALFMFTSPDPKLVKDSDRELKEKIDEWLSSHKTVMTVQKAEVGIKLFQEWQKLLAKRGVISR